MQNMTLFVLASDCEVQWAIESKKFRKGYWIIFLFQNSIYNHAGEKTNNILADNLYQLENNPFTIDFAIRGRFKSIKPSDL